MESNWSHEAQRASGKCCRGQLYFMFHRNKALTPTDRGLCCNSDVTLVHLTGMHTHTHTHTYVVCDIIYIHTCKQPTLILTARLCTWAFRHVSAPLPSAQYRAWCIFLPLTNFKHEVQPFSSGIYKPNKTCIKLKANAFLVFHPEVLLFQIAPLFS